MKTFASLFAFLLFLPALAFAQGSLTPPGAPAPTMKSLAQIEPRTPISSLPYTISVPGSYYLTTNLTGLAGTNGITISTGNASLDLNGFVLTGLTGSLAGVFVSGTYSNLTVRNGEIKGWGGRGVDAYSFSPACVVLDHLTVSDTGDYGIMTSGPAIVRDCISQRNRADGFYVAEVLMTDCASYYNGGSGIVAGGGRVRDCRANGNNLYGIYAISCEVRGCQAINSLNYGIYSSGGDVRDCEVDFSGYYGVYITAGTVSRCKISSSVKSGIYANSPGCQIIGNTCINNNTSGGTNDAGIYLNDANIRVEGNHVTGSGHAGISVSASYGGNVITKNSVAGNGASNYLVPGANDLGPVGTVATSTSPWANISH